MGPWPRYAKNGSHVKATACAEFLLLLLTTAGRAWAQDPQEQAWELLQSGQCEKSATRRAAAAKALGLLAGNPRAAEMAEHAIGDKNPEVRAAAATALGQIGAKTSLPALHKLAAEKDNRVFFAAADALILMDDPAGYDVYYEVLTGERKSGYGLLEEHKRKVRDSKVLTAAILGVAIGYAPYASSAWLAYRTLTKDYRSPVELEALKKLGPNPDPRIGEALVRATTDKNWKVRVAALSAIAIHGDPGLASAITPCMTDKKPAVRYTAAAALLRLSAP